ncbi:RHS repeat domain-containing protein [Clostridium sp. ZBS15]|uniref:RHS repeat domain-containing protein n=1 Tax=Clostridium sp. ZBS15 TaxID=2949969 RepID=UPI00207A7706|nr:RHS repeat domain-containing protein [Clostridium sp. ZBS15]
MKYATIIMKFTYDKENRLIEVKDKRGAKARYKYDCLNNKIYESFKINDTTNKIIHYVYDKVGNLIKKKEEIDGKFISSKNKGKNIWSITKYEYDKNGNLTRIITPKGYEILKVYDEIDRIVKQVLAEQYDSEKDNGVGTTYSLLII